MSLLNMRGPMRFTCMPNTKFQPANKKMLNYGVLVVAVLCVAGARALVQCPPNYCDSIFCAPLEACDGQVKTGGSWCGCCDLCMTQLGEGASCAGQMLLGVPATAECGSGLRCDPSTWTCQSTGKVGVQKRAAGACAARLAEIQRSRENGLPLIGVLEPKCDANGDYMTTQCEGSVCFCVDEGGQQIDDYRVNIGELANMNCKCARDKAAYMKTGLIGKLFFCDKYGNYKTTQVAPAATQAPGTKAPLNIGTGVGQVFPGSPYAVSGACYKELKASQGGGLLGAFVPECDADGNYAPRQCQGSECYCVKKDGTKIAGYSAPIASKYQVTCQCARDKDMAASGGLHGSNIHTCRANGNYQQYQCIGDVCYCTDDAGNRMQANSVNIANINDLKC